MTHNQTKSVKVDNWGVFFLQKLQNFFNKTDHCDLTLQFIDNSQLKVHRLVLSACTDYFNILENTCQMIEDVLIMPNDLQADVIVPIVNFMYTGTLEFQYNMYEKLLKTAKDMNMTVLLKLLEAHRQTSQKPVPVVLNKNAPKRPYSTAITNSTPVFIAPSPVLGNIRGRTYAPRGIVPIRPVGQPPRGPPAKYVARHPKPVQMITHKNVPEPIALVSRFSHTATKSRGPSRYEASEEEDPAMPELFDEQFDEISYESRPLLTADQVKQEAGPEEPFEKLKHGYINKSPPKRSPSGAFLSPPTKKPNLQDVKELAETIRLRKELTMDESEEDPPSYMEDDTHYNDDYDDEQLTTTSPGVTKSHQITIQNKSSPSKASGSPSGNQITVKDESGSVDHAKIISEVLKKYPHLVKNNKNIKLKIMQKSSPPISHVIKKEEVAAVATKTGEVKSYGTTKTTPTATTTQSGHVPTRTTKGAPPTKIIAPKSAATTSTAPSTSNTMASSSGPKKIDAKTMHALIAKGAENISGPWLCLRCGIGGRPISIPSYKSFRKHLINVHKEIIDPLICEHCGLRSPRRLQQIHHMYSEHQVPPPSNLNFPRCTECDHIAINDALLVKHRKAEHPAGPAGQQQCIYCNKVFSKELLLYSHMRQMHKDKAREDGVMDFSDEEPEYALPPQGDSKKINILSNISLLPPLKTGTFVLDTGKQQTLQNITLEPSSEAEAMSNVASGIATSLAVGVDGQYSADNDSQYEHNTIEAALAGVHGEITDESELMTKLISDDGSELHLTPSQKEEIMSQLQGQSGGENIVMVMNQDGHYVTQHGESATTTSDATSTPNSNIMVVYSQESEETLKTNEQFTEEDTAAGGLLEVEATTETEAVDMEVDTKEETVTSEDEVAANIEEIVGEKDIENSQDKGLEESETSTELAVNQIIKEAQKEEVSATAADDADDSKLNESNETAEREKLISTLAGDWTDDDELPTVATTETKLDAKEEKEAVPTKDEKKASTKRTTRSSVTKNKSVDNDILAETTTLKLMEDEEDYLTKDDSAVEEKLDSLLGDWTTEEENNSQTSADISASIDEGKDMDSVLDKPDEEEPEVKAEDDDDEELPEFDDKDVEKSNGSSKSVGSNNDEKKTATSTPSDETKKEVGDELVDSEETDSKHVTAEKTNEISTLIMGDWDEDEDL